MSVLTVVDPLSPVYLSFLSRLRCKIRQEGKRNSRGQQRQGNT
jgi:hypothetical protein